MKFKYLFIAMIAVAGFFASCSDDKDLGQLDGIQLSQSSLSIPVEGGQVEFDVTSAADWKFVTNDKKGNPVDSILPGYLLLARVVVQVQLMLSSMLLLQRVLTIVPSSW